MVRQKCNSVKTRIQKIEATDEKLTGRGGLLLFSRYLTKTGITGALAKMFSFLRKSRKGLFLRSIFHQLVCYFMDGTDFSLTRFDMLKKDSGYAGTIETPEANMMSSHVVKRFFASFSIVRVWLFRRVLRNLFLWRLNRENPEIIKIGVDTMVLDNNDAHEREGVDPTYKKVKGFQPLQFFWGRYLIDAVFRNGSFHSMHGNQTSRTVGELVKLIREHYRQDVPIVLLADSGFYSEELFLLCEHLSIGFIIGGKMYPNIKEYIAETPDNLFSEFQKARNAWFFLDFGSKQKRWEKFWRTIYTKPVCDEDDQVLLDFARPETIIYTNLGMNNDITKSILEVKGAGFTTIEAEAIIDAYHLRARDELVNRAVKDFGTEQLPFKRFESNAAYYYLMIIANFLFESFKYDLSRPDIIPLTWYASTFRRRFLDFAGKIIRSGRRLIMKVPEAIASQFCLQDLWNCILRILPIPIYS